MRMLQYAGFALAVAGCGEGAPGSDNSPTGSQPNVEVTQSVGRANGDGSYSLEGMLPISLMSQGQVMAQPFTVFGTALHGEERQADWYFAHNDQTKQAGLAVYTGKGQVQQGLYGVEQFALTDRQLNLDQIVQFPQGQEVHVADLAGWMVDDNGYHCENLVTGQQILDDQELVARILIWKDPTGLVATAYDFLKDIDRGIDPAKTYANFSKNNFNPTEPPLTVEVSALPAVFPGRSDELLADCRDDRPARPVGQEPMELIDCLNSHTIGNVWAVNEPDVFTPSDRGMQVYVGKQDGILVQRSTLNLESGLIFQISGKLQGGIGFGLGLGHIINPVNSATDVSKGMFLDISIDPTKMYCGDVINSQDHTQPCLDQTVLTSDFRLTITATPSETIYSVNNQVVFRNGPLPNQAITPDFYIDGGKTGGNLDFKLCVGRPN